MTDRPVTVHVATVGLSLFDTLLADSEERIEDAVGDYDLAEEIHRARDRIHDPNYELPDRKDEADRVSDRLVKETSSDSGEAREELEDLLTAIRPDKWPSHISAELASLAADPAKASHRVGENETVLLIASDTGRGLRAALFNALAMTGGKVDRVDYLPEPEGRVETGPGRVAIVRLPGLDAEQDKDFLGAMERLGEFGGQIKNLMADPRSTCRFHLSGGFRVALPFLLGFAQALRSLYGTRVTAHAQYEFSTPPRLIELPLSSPRSDDLRGKLARFGKDGYFTGKGRPSQDAVWSGFAYEWIKDQCLWRLTPFGMALLKLAPETRGEP
ncbi:hypothetical protein [Nocardiopsis sp. LOL_012]|uniref:hypothetical protein n=1 Tax=Nocardiopsis sp. LOL_012 TaxID=3345409 RepID=UPI003A8AF1C6